MSIHYVNVEHTRATAFDGPDLISQTGKVCRKNRGRDLDVAISIHSQSRFGVGRGATGRLFSLAAAGRVFVLRRSVRFTLLRGVAFTLAPAFAFDRFTFAGLFVLPFALALPFVFSFVFLGRGFFGLLSLLFAAELVLRFSLGSSGVTFSGDSPSLAARLISIATVWPVFTTSPGRGN